MEKHELIKIKCDQLKGLFESLDKKTNYREEIINDYHKIISNLIGLLTLNNLEDYQIPSSALSQNYSPFEKYYDGDIVRSKIKQLISVLESERQIIENRNKNIRKFNANSNEEITLSLLFKKELKKISNYIDRIRNKIEKNLLIKIIILIGAVGGGFLLIIDLFK